MESWKTYEHTLCHKTELVLNQCSTGPSFDGLLIRVHECNNTPRSPTLQHAEETRQVKLLRPDWQTRK